MFSNGFPKEWSTLRKLAWLYRTVINAVVSVLKTVIGNPIHITDALAKPVQALSVAIEPIQDLHGYNNPWPAGGGVNKLIECVPGTYTGTYCQAVVSADGTITVSGTTGGSSDTINIPLKAKITTPSEQFYVHMFNTLNADIAPSFELSTDIAGTTINAACSPANRIYTVSTNRLGVEIDRVRFWIGANKNAAATLHPMFALTNSVVPWTPYSNICPISGHTDADVTRTGVNVWDEEWENGSIDGSTGQNEVASGYWRTKNYIPIVPNETYYISCAVTGALRGRFYDINKNYIGTKDKESADLATNRTFIAPSNARFVRFAPNDSVITTKEVSVNYPSSDHDYHAYQGQTYTIDLDGTRYGGTLDVTQGKLTVDRAGVDLGTLSWQFREALGGFSAIVTPTPKNLFVAISSCYPYAGAYSDVTDKAFGYVYLNQVFVKDSAYSDAETLKTALNGQTLVYELATPTTIQLTPTQVELLQGENNLFSDGTMTLVYLADGNASEIEALNILLGGRYVNNHGEDEPTDREALDILLGGTR